MKLTKIAVALVAVLAMSALVASSASAAFQLKTNTAGKNAAMVFGEDNGNHVFKVDGQSVTCTTAVFEKESIALPANTVPGVNASYNGCTAFGFAGANVKMNNCTYTFNEINTQNATNSFSGTVANVCGATPIKVNANVFGSECEVQIGGGGNNASLTNANYNNNATGVTITAAINNITATKTQDNGLCPLSGTGTVNNATYNGPTVTNATESINITIN